MDTCLNALTCDQFLEFLKKFCPDIDEEGLNVIKRAKINGRRVLKCSTTTDWSHIGLAYGDAVDILGAINDLQQGVIFWDPAVHDENIDPLHKEAPCLSAPQAAQNAIHTSPSRQTVSINVDPLHKEAPPLSTLQSAQNEIHTSPSRQIYCNDSRRSACSSDCVSVIDPYESIKEYFDIEEFTEMSDYDKSSYLNLKRNYEYALKNGIKAPLPGFMKPQRGLKAKACQSTGASSSRGTCASSSRTTRRSSRKTVNHREPVVEQQRAATEQVIEAESMEAPPDVQQESDERTAVSNVGEKNPEGSADNVLHVDQVLQPSSATSDVAQFLLPRSRNKRRKRKNPNDHLSDEEFAEKLPKYDVQQILSNAGGDLRAVRKSLLQKGVVIGAERKLLMRTLLKSLHYDEKGQIKTVTTDMKSGLAASVVSAYPAFRDSVPNKRP